MRLRLLVVLAAAVPAGAQLPSPSAAALGMGDSHTALARGFSAVAWNPAGLGLSGNPGFSLAILPMRGVGSLGPITLSDLADYEDEIVPLEVREAWLQSVEAQGAQTGAFQAGVTEIAFSSGRFAFQLGTSATAVANLGPGAMELIMFGNAGRTGEPRDITGAGSGAVGVLTTTAAASYGQAVHVLPGMRLSIGITGKYVMGHALVFAEDLGTNVTATPIGGQVFFPVVHPRTEDDDPINGSGIGVDLGAGLEMGPWTFGLAVQNVFNTFEWDPSEFEFRYNYIDIETNESNFESYPLELLPELHAAVLDLKFKPVVAAGAAFRLRPNLVFSGDLRMRTDEDGLEGGPKRFLGVGMEYRPVTWFPIRLGGSALTDATMLTGGLGLNFGWLNLNVSGGVFQSDVGNEPVGAVTLSFGGR